MYGNNQNTAANGAGAAGTATAWGTNGATAGAVVINGSLGSSTVTTVLNATAKATADQINAVKSSTGVSATARTDMQVTFGAAGSYSLTLQSDNSSPVSVSFNTSGGAGLSAAVAAINDQTSKTGVTAALNTAGTAVILSNSTGNDIYLANLDTAITNAGTASVQKLDQAGAASGAPVVVAAAGAAANQALVSGNITLDSEKSFSITSASTALTTGGSALNKVADLDVTTFKKASDALKTVDSALSFINGERAKLGALQSRFETSISNLQVTSENLSASRSRILDADFAAETANLSRSQILQQAGTAMVAQANQLPQGVLALLR